MEQLSEILQGIKCSANVNSFEEKLLARFSKDEKSKYVLSYPLDVCTELAQSQTLDLAAQELWAVKSDYDIVECTWQDGTPALLAIASPLVYVCSFTSGQHVKV